MTKKMTYDELKKHHAELEFTQLPSLYSNIHFRYAEGNLSKAQYELEMSHYEVLKSKLELAKHMNELSQNAAELEKAFKAAGFGCK